MRQNWDDVKAHIKEYYKTQNKSLEELKKLMIENHDFDKSRRSYLNMIVKWGYAKKKRRRSVQGGNPFNADVSPNAHRTASTTSESNYSMVPMLPPLWNQGQGSWITAGYLEHPFQDTVGHPYNNYQSFQTSVPTPENVSIPYQSSQAEGSAERALDIHGQTPLHHAAIEGDLEQVQMLLLRDYSLHDIDHYGNQPLHYAAEKLCTGTVDLMLKNGANVNARGAEGRTPLHLALRSTKIVNRLMREHPTRTTHDDKGNTALHAALAAFSKALNRTVFVSTIGKLVHSGYDVNKRNSAGETPFHMALGVYSSTSKIVHQILILFLQNQADVSLPDTSNKMPFQVFLDTMNVLSFREDHVVDLCQLFLRCGADPNTISNGRLLFQTSITGSPYFTDHFQELVNSLCESVDVNKLTENGDSPLHMLAQNRSRSSFSKWTNILLRRGANPMQRDRDGDLPVYHAYRSKKPHGYSYWHEGVWTLVNSYSASDMPVERSTTYPNDHIWWLEYQRLSQQETCFAGGLRRLAGYADYLPNDIGKDFSEFLLIEAAHHMLKSLKENFLTHKSAFEQGTIAGQGFQDAIVNVLRECLRLKLDIDQSWYHLTLEFFD
ncbi:hypothetical protein MMC27_004464 [Xylographa pallens]|nr:hypothetical protein [Xylographa pallens]